jgi:hypothetical protein
MIPSIPRSKPLGLLNLNYTALLPNQETMSDNPDLSLPAKAPSMAQYHDKPMTLYPAALYTLVDLTDIELGDLVRECEAGCINLGSEPGTSVCLAPQPRFVGQPLRAVFDYHLELGTQDTFDPRYFIVAVDKDWQAKGVILVTLDDDALDCNVDSFRIKAVDVGLSILNLQIDNSSWKGEKSAYRIRPDVGDRNENGDDDANDDDANDSDNDDSDEDDDYDDNDGPPAPTKNTLLGYYVPIYIHSSLSEDEVIAKLEPMVKQKVPENYVCRIQAKLTPASSAPSTTSVQDLIQQAVTLHPLRCAKNRYQFKTQILIVDTADPVEHGMLMVKLPPWEARCPSMTRKAAAHEVGKELALATSPYIRIPYSCYQGLQTRFLILSNGYADWPSDDVRAQPVFIVFQYNTRGQNIGFNDTWINSGAASRKPGEERLAWVGWDIPGRGPAPFEWKYGEAVKLFPWCCRANRFVEGLDKTFFMCVDGNYLASDMNKAELLLVRRKWDGNVGGRTWDDFLNLPVDGVKNVRVPISEALSLLEKGSKGETDGMNESLRDFFL